VLSTPCTVDGVSEVLGDVESVEADLLPGPMQEELGGRDVGLPHIHRDGLDLHELGRVELVEEVAEALGPSIVRNVAHCPSFDVGNDRHVLVALLERCLVNGNSAGRELISTCEAALDRALHDPIDLAPRHPQAPTYCGDGCLEQPADRVRLEGGGEPRASVAPGNSNLSNAVLGAANTWDLGNDDRPILAGVEVAPLPLASVVDAALRPALRARQAGSGSHLDGHLDLFCPCVQLHARDAPGLPQPQDLGVDIAALHPAQTTPPSGGRPWAPSGGHPTRNPEDP